MLKKSLKIPKGSS